MIKRLTVKQKADLYKVVFDTPDGRKVLADINIQCKVFEACNSDLEEGARRAALYISQFVAHPAERFPEWMRETEKDLL